MSVSFDSSDRSGSETTISTAASTLAPDQTPVRPAGTHRHLPLSDLRLLRRIGSGDIGSVYLSELQTPEGGRRTIAAKVMDRRELEERGKEGRARTEREVLGMLDHPFLPALLGVAEDDTWTCLLTEFCSGGDLHVLRQRQQGRRFPEDAVRFYASEIVAALEYLHMLGIVYRDLKPENVLIRSDGHIMLTDFDLSLRSEGDASPAIRLVPDAASLGVPPFVGTSCVSPRCIMPAVSCFHPKKSKRRRRSSRGRNAGGLEFVAEPVDLRSMSFVGTHEYLAPEIVSGEGHGSAVDWWTLGIFIYELLYGATPFKGSDNDLTLANIVARALEFPKDPPVSSNTKDLIARLLAKDPSKRIGSTMGASAIKRHPFFKGVNWALLRCALPPYIPPPLSRCCSSLDVSEDDGGPDSPVEYY